VSRILRLSPCSPPFFGDESVDVRVAAVSALGRIGTKRVVAPLAMALADDAPSVRSAAARALASLDVPVDCRAVQRSLAQIAGQVSTQEIRMLAWQIHGDEATEVVDAAIEAASRRLIRMLTSDHQGARSEALSGLVRLGVAPSPAIARWLLDAIDDSYPHVRIEAAKLLALSDASTRQRLVARLCAQLHAEDWQVRRTALIGLRDVASADIFPDLAASFARERYAPLRELALMAALATGVAGTRSLAELALRDRSRTIQEQARAFLGRERNAN
jgi:HEAT repeat protein